MPLTEDEQEELELLKEIVRRQAPMQNVDIPFTERQVQVPNIREPRAFLEHALQQGKQVVQGERPLIPSEDIPAVAGGAAGVGAGLLTRNPVAAGALAGGASTLAQRLLEGEKPAKEIAKEALAGTAIGAATGGIVKGGAQAVTALGKAVTNKTARVLAGPAQQALRETVELFDQAGATLAPAGTMGIRRGAQLGLSKIPIVGAPFREGIKRTRDSLRNQAQKQIARTTGRKAQDFEHALLGGRQTKLIEKALPKATKTQKTAAHTLDRAGVQALRKELTAAEFSYLQGSVLFRMGLTAPGKRAGTGMQNWEIDEFITRWEQMPVETRKLWFPQSHKNMTKWVKAGKVLRDPEFAQALETQAKFGTAAGAGLTIGSAAGIIYAPQLTISLAALAGSGRLTASLLSKPSFVRWLAQGSRKPTERAWQKHLAKLSGIAASNPEIRPEIDQFLTNLEQITVGGHATHP